MMAELGENAPVYSFLPQIDTYGSNETGLGQIVTATKSNPPLFVFIPVQYGSRDKY